MTGSGWAENALLRSPESQPGCSLLRTAAHSSADWDLHTRSAPAGCTPQTTENYAKSPAYYPTLELGQADLVRSATQTGIFPE